LVPDLWRNLRQQHCGCQVKSGCKRAVAAAMLILPGECPAKERGDLRNTSGRVAEAEIFIRRLGSPQQRALRSS